MEEKNENGYFKSNMRIIQFASHYWKFLLGVAIVSGILATFFSGPQFIDPKYKSEAVIYPANKYEYTDETRLDQMQQYLLSNLIKEALIRQFNLYEEYEIDSNYIYAKAYMNAAYSEHVKIEETRYESIRITVLSKSPRKAKQMVEEILNQANLIVRKKEREKIKEVIDYVGYHLELKKKRIDSLESKMQEISTKYGVLDKNTQSREVTKAYLQFLLQGKKGSDFEKANELYDNIGRYGQNYTSLQIQLDSMNAQYAKNVARYDEAKKDYFKEITYSYIIVHPEVPSKKSYPIRVAIVISAIISTVGFSFILMLLLGYQKKKHV